ncbi:MAG TPA: glycerophosphodiester phosphodiesterase [Mycobacteriales bacterium]|nr:glycerophosphodiester phosphodiesterase [Mycobacteriales bacterium]
MLLLAHRGLPGATRPENTLAAVAAALDAGADGVEVDLRLTADGVLALSHDPDLSRTAGLPVAVAETPWPRLQEVAGAHGLALARAEDLLALAQGRRVVLEVKQPPPGPAATARTALAVAGLLRSLERAGLPLDVTVSSFAPPVVERVRRLLPPRSVVRTALLGRPMVRPSSLLRQALQDGHDEVHPHVSALLAQPEAVATAHAVGLAVVPWTVNRRREVRRCERLGVDALITDVPAAARAALSGAGTVA